MRMLLSFGFVSSTGCSCTILGGKSQKLILQELGGKSQISDWIASGKRARTSHSGSKLDED
jgi:hypothetical protein